MPSDLADVSQLPRTDQVFPSSLGAEIRADLGVRHRDEPVASKQGGLPIRLTIEEASQRVLPTPPLIDRVDRPPVTTATGGPFAVKVLDVTTLDFDDRSTQVREEHKNVDLNIATALVRETY